MRAHLGFGQLGRECRCPFADWTRGVSGACFVGRLIVLSKGSQLDDQNVDLSVWNVAQQFDAFTSRGAVNYRLGLNTQQFIRGRFERGSNADQCRKVWLANSRNVIAEPSICETSPASHLGMRHAQQSRPLTQIFGEAIHFMVVATLSPSCHAHHVVITHVLWYVREIGLGALRFLEILD